MRIVKHKSPRVLVQWGERSETLYFPVNHAASRLLFSSRPGGVLRHRPRAFFCAPPLPPGATGTFRAQCHWPGATGWVPLPGCHRRLARKCLHLARAQDATGILCAGCHWRLARQCKPAPPIGATTTDPTDANTTDQKRQHPRTSRGCCELVGLTEPQARPDSAIRVTGTRITGSRPGTSR